MFIILGGDSDSDIETFEAFVFDQASNIIILEPARSMIRPGIGQHSALNVAILSWEQDFVFDLLFLLGVLDFPDLLSKPIIIDRIVTSLERLDLALELTEIPSPVLLDDLDLAEHLLGVLGELLDLIDELG